MALGEVVGALGEGMREGLASAGREGVGGTLAHSVAVGVSVAVEVAH